MEERSRKARARAINDVSIPRSSHVSPPRVVDSTLKHFDSRHRRGGSKPGRPLKRLRGSVGTGPDSRGRKSSPHLAHLELRPQFCLSVTLASSRRPIVRDERTIDRQIGHARNSWFVIQRPEFRHQTPLLRFILPFSTPQYE